MVIAATTTVTDMETARRIARAIVESRLAACVQMTAIESVYRWEGTLQHEPEVRLVFKSTRAQWEALCSAIAELHPYTVPAIHAVALDMVHTPYAEWVAEQVGGPSAVT